MSTLTPSIIALVATSVVCQVFGVSLMPLTKGLTEVVPTIGRGIAFAAGLGIMTRSINRNQFERATAIYGGSCAAVRCNSWCYILWRICIYPTDLNSVPFVSDTRFCEQHVLKNN